jgi:hypothetical protein
MTSSRFSFPEPDFNLQVKPQGQGGCRSAPLADPEAFWELIWALNCQRSSGDDHRR